ncbi:hypothetical protein [Kitasatospora sp. NPDC057223]|uniref:hypothetical protein n=1 Tax=Kitasatospora sp. NPDC057223 TaxID=3346055 RepID=UPI003634BF61
MTLPGFHAEAPLRRSSSPYATGPLRAAADAPIRPMWTEEQRRLLLECDRSYNVCEGGCTDSNFPTYEEWQNCNTACNQGLDACLAPLYGDTGTG